MGILADAQRAVRLLKKGFASRSAVRHVRHALAERPAHEEQSFQIAVYFADSKVNMYQIRQWYRPLQDLAARWPVVILARSASGARAILEDDELPVEYVPSVRSLESVVAEQDIRIVFYVNQNTRNFQMFRYGRRWHVFINHGESDKMYMTTNQFKAYDYALVAGEAARERLSRALWNYDLDARTIEIGRPQADYFDGTLPYEPDERIVVLYAPTWEGDRPAAHYGSIRTHGESLVRELLATGRHRVIYRAHPRSGVIDPEYGAAHKRIIAAIEAANSADASAQHIVDDGPELGWQLSASDVAVLDISAMVYDRLAAGKPLIVTRPADPDAAVDMLGYLAACEWLTEAAAPSIVGEIDRVRGDEESTERLAYWAGHYFGDTSPGASTRRFRAAIERLMREWETWHARSSPADDAAPSPER